MEKTNKFSVTIPRYDNEGVALNLQAIHICDEILAIAGGFSAQDVAGEWRNDEGVTFHDESTIVFSYVSDEQAEKLLARCPEWCEILRQQALMVELQAVQTAFVVQRVAA